MTLNVIGLRPEVCCMVLDSDPDSDSDYGSSFLKFRAAKARGISCVVTVTVTVGACLHTRICARINDRNTTSSFDLQQTECELHDASYFAVTKSRRELEMESLCFLLRHIRSILMKFVFPFKGMLLS
jgi:hypothetical protein